VDEGVDEAKKGRVSSRSILHSPPDTHGHNSVMDNMKGGDVVKLLPCQEEECVNKFNKLGKIVVVGRGCHSQGFLTVTVVDWLASIVILSEPSIVSQSPKQPRRQSNHEKVVDTHDPSDIERLSIPHESGANDFDKESIGKADCKSRKG
jgi:hypothetical protein